MIPMSLPAASGANPRRFRLLLLAILVLGLAHIAERAAYWSGNWNAHSSLNNNSVPVSIRIGTTGFELPLDYITRPTQRAVALSGTTSFNALKLSMAWPYLTPAIGSQDAGTFSSTRQTLIVELEHSPGRESMRARLEPFYRRLARGGELNGPNGLKILTLSSRSAATPDLIAYDPDRPNGFIARCMTTKSTQQATCYRAVVFSPGLELRYRFDQDLLAEWRRIDDAVIRKVETFRQG